MIVVYAAMGLRARASCSPRSRRPRKCSAIRESRGEERFSASDASRGVVLKLSGLFALDAFGGGFVIQSLAAYWFYLRFGVQPATLGGIFFGANVFAGISALLASRLAKRFGLMRTMVFTHLPSNVLLILVAADAHPAAGHRCAAAALQHQPDGRAHPPVLHHGGRAPGRTLRRGRNHRRRAHHRRGHRSGARRASCSPRPSLINLPFFIAGGLKIVYDLLLYRAFVSLAPAEEVR